MSYPTFPPPPAAPPPPPPAAPSGPPPAALRPVVGLLIANLTLSIALTVCVLVLRNSVVDYQLAHVRHIAAGDRPRLRRVYLDTMWIRVLGILVASVVYTFLVRALLRGRRWAYRRVLLLSVAGMIGIALLFTTPYPPWMRVEQVLQILTLGALLYFVTRAPVRAYCQDARPRWARGRS